MAKKRPLTNTNLVTEFGGIEDTEGFKEDGPAQQDYLYVPGFTGMRVQRDIDLKRYADGEIKAHEVSTLPVNCRWFRTSKGANNEQPDHTRTVHARNQGYRVVTKDDLGQGHPWLTELPPNAMIAPDGVIRSSGNDLALYVIDRDGAAKNAYRKKMKAEQMVDGIEMAGGGLGNVGQAHRGADPQIEKRIGEVTK